MCVLTQHCKDDKRTAFTTTHKDDKRTAFTTTHKAQIVSTTKTPPPTHKRLYYSKDELSSRVVVEFYHRRPNRERRERCEGRVVFFVAVFIARVKMCTRPLFAVISLRLEFDFFFLCARRRSPLEGGRTRPVERRRRARNGTNRTRREESRRGLRPSRSSRAPSRRVSTFVSLFACLGVCSPKDEMGIFWIKQN